MMVDSVFHWENPSRDRGMLNTDKNGTIKMSTAYALTSLTEWNLKKQLADSGIRLMKIVGMLFKPCLVVI